MGGDKKIPRQEEVRTEKQREREEGNDLFRDLQGSYIGCAICWGDGNLRALSKPSVFIRADWML
jgi:hypothetical protein